MVSVCSLELDLFFSPGSAYFDFPDVDAANEPFLDEGLRSLYC